MIGSELGAAATAWSRLAHTDMQTRSMLEKVIATTLCEINKHSRKGKFPARQKY
jgi:hypothetical protein